MVRRYNVPAGNPIEFLITDFTDFTDNFLRTFSPFQSRSLSVLSIRG